MPTSLLDQWPRIINLVETTDRHDSILDVGPGWGKAATLLREYLNVKPFRIDAVEAHYPYVVDHHLGLLYDRVWWGSPDGGDAFDTNAGVLEAKWQFVDGRDHPTGARYEAQPLLDSYDVVLMVDVIEHLTLADGFDLVKRIPGTVVICTPTGFDPSADFPTSERHLSLWTRDHWRELAEGREPSTVVEQHAGWIVRLGPWRAW